MYLEGGVFAEKLIRHTHQEMKHLGVANVMAEIRREWWIPQLRSKVKKIIRSCIVCKLFSTRPFKQAATAAMPLFRTESDGKPFQTTGVDFAGPLLYKISKKEQGKCYVLIFTCASSRAVHLELTKTHTADEFQQNLNAFITRRTRPKLIISDNAAEFKSTAEWIRKLAKTRSYKTI